MLDYAIKQTDLYIDTMPKQERKKYGQFFTNKNTAQFMAALYKIPKELTNLSVLDTGAGSGILSCALIERLVDTNVRFIDLTCYENDEKIINLLLKNLENAKKNTSIEIRYRVVMENYVTSQSKDFNKGLEFSIEQMKYDIVIGNPPYLKIAKEAKEALAMPSICYGAPNLYFLFAAMALFNLRKDGEMVYIIPRSWTSGAYFKNFRQYFLTKGKLEHVHLFISRDKVFKKEQILQETIIIKVKKTEAKLNMVEITSSESSEDFNNMVSFMVPYNIVVSKINNYVHLATNEKEIATLEKLNQWKYTLPDLGLKMKTGVTVDFRNRELLRDKYEDNAIPLFYAQHIENGRVNFPINKSNEYILTDKKGLIQANRNYLFVKRFTSKEENRRLQCGIYLSEQFPNYSFISTQNKLNFIDNAENNLSIEIVYGLYVLFNSCLYDQYYRILNGSTQVNSTEINTMPVPSINVIHDMGVQLLSSNNLTESNCDSILEDFIDAETKRYKRIS